MMKDHWLLEASREAGLRVEPREDFYSLTVPEAWGNVAAQAEVSTLELARMVALHFRLDLADLSDIEERAVALVPGSIAKGHRLMPIRETYHHLVIATSDPTDYEEEQAVAFASGRAIELLIGPAEFASRPIYAAWGAGRGRSGECEGAFARVVRA